MHTEAGDREVSTQLSRESASTTSEAVDLTVVIPTYNRCDRLRRVLQAMDDQALTSTDGERFSFEVVVVSDGSTDGTTEMVRTLPTSYDLRLIEQPNAGPAAARNTGAQSANGIVILFIDDDVVPGPACLQRHFQRHRAATDLVVIGPMLTPSDAKLHPWIEWEQFQLYKQYRRFAAGEPAYPRQFYTGNASLRRSAFEVAGGFDTEFRRAEDVELADRLFRLGQSFVFEPHAEALHYADRSLDSWLMVAFDYGRHDVTFARGDQPWMRERIADGFNGRNVLARHFVRWATSGRSRARRVATVACRIALTFDRLHLATPTRMSLSVAYGVTYYAGVASEVGSPATFRRYVNSPAEPGASRLSALFLLEQTLGHVTHSSNLRSIVAGFTDVDSTFVGIDPSLTGPWRFIPGWTNWTVRAGVRAGRSVRRVTRSGQRSLPDATFVHTQVPAILLGRWMKRIPTVVSLDATPRQYDELGQFYQHRTGPRFMEMLKLRANVRCFARAAHLVTWSEWAKAALVRDYGVLPESVTVIAPGVEVDRWASPISQERAGAVRILFVGGDLQRKGGQLLLDAARQLRLDITVPEFEVHLVTTGEVEPEDGVVVHRGLGPNSPSLIDLYHEADIFCLPTYGDCLPMVLAEAGAASLPLVATDVGAISEIVRNDETGCLIPPGDVDSLSKALHTLLASRELRDRLGRGARILVEREHDATKNARRIVDVMRRVAG